MALRTACREAANWPRPLRVAVNISPAHFSDPNFPATGALIDGLEDVPVGTRFVIHFGEGQLEVATVRRVAGEQLGIQFDKTLVNDGTGGLCTRTRISPCDLISAGLPHDFEASTIRTPIGQRDGRIDRKSTRTNS